MNGPKISTAALSKATSTGKGNKGNHFVNFLMAQSKHDLLQSFNEKVCAHQNGHRRHNYAH